MQLPALHNGIIVNRYKRFLADVELSDGQLVTAHCPNTGRMTGCWKPGAPVQLSYSDNPRRKLAWTLERVDMGAGWIGVNTHRVNGVIAEGIRAGLIPALAGYQQVDTEFTIQHGGIRSRLDMVLREGDAADAFVEVKNVTLLEAGKLKFPDARSERGLKHLKLLMDLVARGNRGVMVYALNRPEGAGFAAAGHIDPGYARMLTRAVEAGVEVIPLRLVHTETGIEVGSRPPYFPDSGVSVSG